LIHHKKRPILYVDDTIEQRYAMRRILETEGFAVLEAGTGKEAFALMQENPALAVVDVRLPDISGYDLSRRLKEMEPYLPILQVSASFSDPDKRAAGFSGGADAYIAQPVHPSELVSLVRRMLRTSEAEESLRFLATIGPRLSSTLSLSEATENIRTAMAPHFADRCFIYLKDHPGQPASFWPDDPSVSTSMRSEMERESQSKSVTMATSRLLFAPLSATQSGFGSIAFHLDKDREYSATDVVLASDLANRAGLALQNCLLFASEQATRSALVQAEKLATAGRMSAAIAHEINNPLEALTNLIYILEQSPDATHNMREIASAALGEVTRLAHITRQTLGFYRELRAPSNLDLSDSVLDTLDIYRKRIESKKIDIVLDLTNHVCIRGIKGEIRQVISNLLVNAMEAMEEHGKLVLKTSTQGNKAMLSIEDSGPGIPEALQAKIFEPFFTTKQGTGTGLGLWITHTIVEKHEGEIVLTTHTGADHGTCFKLVFPRIEASQPANEAAGR
jgi:two-component system NtrC family sensor kinase